jgi:hypothetical protein
VTEVADQLSEAEEEEAVEVVEEPEGGDEPASETEG